MKLLIKIFCILTLVAVTASFVVQDDNAIYFDNAYVSGRLITIQAPATGTLEFKRHLKDTYVSKGQIVALITPEITNMEITQLEEELRLKINDEVKKCIDKDMTGLEQALNQLDSEFAKNELRRVEALYAKSLKSDAELDEAQTAYNRIMQVSKIKAWEHQINLLDNHLEILQRPAIKHLLVRLRKAWYQRELLTITAPYDGYIYENYAYSGQQVELGDKLILFVPREDVIVEANVLESRLPYIESNSSVEVISFIHGKDRPFKGRVISVVPSSTSTFSGLPRNIGDSNWIKVEQRIPVRIKLTGPDQLLHSLPIGTSVKVRLPLHANRTTSAPDEVMLPSQKAAARADTGQQPSDWEDAYDMRVAEIINQSRANLQPLLSGDCSI